MDLPKYVYDITTGKLVEAAPATTDLLAPDRAQEIRYMLYTDDTPYRMQREWLEDVPFDVYSIDIFRSTEKNWNCLSFNTEMVGKR